MGMRLEAEEASISANVETEKNPGVSDKENQNTSNIETVDTNSTEPEIEEKNKDDTVDKEVVNKDSAVERDKKLQEIREICIEKLPQDESQSITVQTSKFVEPISS